MNQMLGCGRFQVITSINQPQQFLVSNLRDRAEVNGSILWCTDTRHCIVFSIPHGMGIGRVNVLIRRTCWKPLQVGYRTTDCYVSQSRPLDALWLIHSLHEQMTICQQSLEQFYASSVKFRFGSRSTSFFKTSAYHISAKREHPAHVLSGLDLHKELVNGARKF